MISSLRLYRLHVGLALVGATALIFAVVVVSTTVSFSLPSTAALASACRNFLLSEFSIGGLLSVTLMTLGLVVSYRAMRSLWRQFRDQRNFLHSLRPVTPVEKEGSSFLLVDNSLPQAFCAGYLRPRVYLSTSALARLSPEELRAVLAHEHHHSRRRDPLRLMITRVLAEALFFLPALKRLAERYAALAELEADRASLNEVKQRGIVASAMLVFGEGINPSTVVGISPERVDHLLGLKVQWQLPVLLLVTSVIAALGLVLLALSATSAMSGSTANVPMLLAKNCMLFMVSLPAVVGLLTLLSRRLHPAS